MGNKKIWLIAIVFFGLAFVGCDDGSNSTKTIDSRFRGKWEVTSVLQQGNTYTLPVYTLFRGYVYSAGYEITATSIISYSNGDILQSASGVYSDGNSLYSANGELGCTMEINGNNAALTYQYGTEYCVKKTYFSWE